MGYMQIPCQIIQRTSEVSNFGICGVMEPIPVDTKEAMCLKC